jgi:hypothetical protein
MVLVANMELYGGVRWRKITGVEATYFENYGKSLLFDVRGDVSPTTGATLPYDFSTRLSMPNYASVTPLPSATINSKFELELRLALGSTDLVNEGSGRVTISYYSVELGQQFIASFHYEVKISVNNVSLSHSNFLTRLPMPVPTSLLL